MTNYRPGEFAGGTIKYDSGGFLVINQILMIERTYRSAVSRVDNIPGLLRALNRWYQTYTGYNDLHPCVIDGRAALVCQYDLSKAASQAFVELLAIADQYQIYLKEDSRVRDEGLAFHNRRSNMGLVLSFCLGLMASSRLVTAEELQRATANGSVTAQVSAPVNSMQVKIEAGRDGEKVISLRHVPPPTAAEVIRAYDQKKSTMKVDGQAEANIKQFLHNVYKPEPGDPPHITADMADMARYYAQYPEVIALLEALREKKLVLKYKADNWQAQAWGNEFAVDSVTIFFDTRVAAQLLSHADCQANPACTISPADALLHELLHAKLMLIDSRHFIDVGGMQQSLYPFEHEREVMAGENRLYQEMNQQDGRSRPLRYRHVGGLFHVNCAACRPAEMLAAN